MRKDKRKLSGRSEPMAFAPVVRGENKLQVVNSGDAAEIVLLGAVGKSWWDDSGITEKEFRDALKTIPNGKPITVKVNSEGGSVQEGLGIYNAIKERSQDITVKITGYALSIASVFPLAASRVVSPKSAIWMIHCAWSWASGNAADMRKQAEMLDTHDETLLSIYEENTGKSRAELRAAMESETWFSGAEAVDFGLADETDETTEDASASYRPLSGDYLSRCKNALPQILAAAKRDTQNQPANPQAAESVVVATNQPAPVTASANPISAPTQGTAKQNQTQNIMNRAQIIALLKTWGVSVNDGMTDDQLSALVAAGKPNPTEPSALAKVEAQLADERKARITDRVTRAAENKIANDKLSWWIDNAIKDEAGTLAQIEAMPAAHVGAEPLGAGNIELGGAPVLAGWGEKPTPMVENIFKAHATQAARYEAIKANYSAILAEAQRKDGIRSAAGRAPVFNSNTYSATLTTSFLIMGATTKLGPKLAALGAFSRDVSVDPYKPLATGVMKFTTSAQDGSTTQTNPTDFESSTQVVDAVSITVAQYENGGSISNGDLNSGIRMEDISRAVVMGLGAKLMSIATAPITLANFTNTPITAALNPAAFGFQESRQAYAGIKYANTRNLILDVEYVAGLLNNPSYFQKSIEQQTGAGHWTNVFGWDNIYENTVWPSAENVHGFACDPQAIGVVAGLPLVDGANIPGGILSVSTGVIPGANIPVAAYLWFSTKTRTYWMSYASMLGAAKLDATAGVIIKSA